MTLSQQCNFDKYMFIIRDKCCPTTFKFNFFFEYMVIATIFFHLVHKPMNLTQASLFQ
jgi:hypothetical protein